MSSVLGLKARPQSANWRPLRSAPKRATTLSTSTCFWRSLAASTAFSTFRSTPALLAVLMSAFTSFGKHEPP